MAQRTNYWSCSAFADWLRGTMKPAAHTMEGWATWRDQAKKNHPVRYWLAEEGLDTIQNTLWWPLDKMYDLKYYINNRWVTRTHQLTAHPRDIKRGTWCDVGNRFLPCLFNELVDYVEIELAWWHIAWDKEARELFKAPWWSNGWWRWRTWRSPEAGVANLHWQMSLVWTADELGENDPLVGQPTHQAGRAQEALALYQWWTTVYRNRVDPYERSGWTQYCAQKRENDTFWNLNDQTDEGRIERVRILDELHRIEEQYRQEDEEMMIRLIKLRDYLWT